MFEHEVFDIHGFVFFGFAGTVGNVAMEFAVFGNGVANEFLAAPGFLANFVFEPLLLFVTGKLHG